MTSMARAATSALFAFSASAAFAAEPTPKIAAAPAWAVPAEVPPPDSKKSAAPLQFLVGSTQARVTASGVESYVEYAAVPQTTAGLQALGNVTVPWNVERSDLVIHKIAIQRQGSTVDLLKSGEMLVLRRENHLEKAVLDGIRTVVIPAKGLEIGDTLSVAFTYTPKPSTVGNKPEDLQTLTAPLAINRLERRFLVPDDVKVGWKLSQQIPQPQISRREEGIEHRFVVEDVEPFTAPNFSPSRFVQPIIQLSGYGSWSEVADELRPLFDKARKLVPDSALMREADTIAAASADPAARMLAALRLAQERVRYVALLLGEGAYVPSSADESWDRKFGDCKGKTALLLALLDRLGIQAEPVLVSTKHDDRLGEQLPSLYIFDHVLVRARLGGRDYYLDATDYGQRTLEELAISSYSHLLALREAANLEAIPIGTLTQPVKEVALTWDRSAAGVDGDSPFEATLVLRGATAAEMRAKQAAATDAKRFDDELKGLVPAIANDDLEIVEKLPENEDGTFVVRFKGTAEMDWSPFEGERNTRFGFTNDTVSWSPDFARKEGIGKDWPVVVGAKPYWEKLTETVVLPDGGKGYSIDGTTFERTVAGSSIKRSSRLEGNRATIVSEFRHFKREISAEEARAAIPLLEDINDDYAYVVGPPERKKKKPRG